MKIAYVTTYDSSDMHKWSGLGFFIRRSLERQGHDVVPIGPVDDGMRPLAARIRRFVDRASGRHYLADRHPRSLARLARRTESLLHGDFDVVFSPGSLPLAHLSTDLPVVLYSDATFGGLLGYYDAFRRLSPSAIRHGMDAESRALARCRVAVFASDWAAETAQRLHGLPPDRTRVVPFGANLLEPPRREDVVAAVETRSDKRVDLLFWGVEWERKRGDFAVEVVKGLRSQGVDAYLHVVGIRDLPLRPQPDFVIDHGFLSKAEPLQRASLEEILKSSHFLLLPTRAEAFGLVFAEASAYGIPSLAPATGGVPTAITEARNGKLFDLEDEPSAYASWILDLLAKPGAYRQLAISSRHEYENRLDWEGAGRVLSEILFDVVRDRSVSIDALGEKP